MSNFDCLSCEHGDKCTLYMATGIKRCMEYKKKKDEIKDSGERTVFPTGSVRDMHEGKGRMDLLPWAAIMEVSKHCEAGAKKYGEHNVDRGIPTSSLCDSGMRHLAKYLDGWTDEPHLVAAAWNMLWAIEMEIKHPECVDTPWKKDVLTDGLLQSFMPVSSKRNQQCKQV